MPKAATFLAVALIVGMICALACSTVYGAPLANPPAFWLIYSYWLLVTVALGSQIVLNARSGRAYGQLEPHVFLSNWLENVGWILFSWTTGDPVYLVSRFAGLWFDQIVFWQILISQKGGTPRERRLRIVVLAGPPFLVSLFALIGIPLLFAEIMQKSWMHTTVSSIIGIVWLYVVLSWVRQLKKNRSVGVLSGRDFSLLIPLLIELFLLFALLNEYLSGSHRIVPYVTMGISLLVNTALLIQSALHHRAWLKLTSEERARLGGC